MRRTIILGALLAAAAIGIPAQSIDRTIESIRKLYNDTAERARLCETDEEHGNFGELVMNELTINSRSHQWRAVGIFNETYKFFYKGGDSEEHLYPDQLVFVKVGRKVSAREYWEEYLYDDAGRLIFYFQKAVGDDDVPGERRVYFKAGKAIRIVEDGVTRDRLRAADVTVVTEITASGAKIKDVFARSIKL